MQDEIYLQNRGMLFDEVEQPDNNFSSNVNSTWMGEQDFRTAQTPTNMSQYDKCADNATDINRVKW